MNLYTIQKNFPIGSYVVRKDNMDKITKRRIVGYKQLLNYGMCVIYIVNEGTLSQRNEVDSISRLNECYRVIR